MTTDANIIKQSDVNGDTRLRLNETDSATEVTVEYEGYELGNVNEDGTVDADDASDIAKNVTSGNDAAYGDVNGDGQVTAVDAMLVQQYSEGNIGADYNQGGA
ncbi:hypothetical protein AUR66_20165 [Haloferax profundi]|uniref:Dockerin domain-containing protein n=1 Tax=Haloferax profundi TaxID=1544718 RepID=A0A0W1RAQ1_9EURY|nr:hypothetical protein AUR66_20165 [Haloferax profundi]